MQVPTLRKRGSGFSSYEIELRNRVTQNDVTLRVTNSKSKNKKFYEHEVDKWKSPLNITVWMSVKP